MDMMDRSKLRLMIFEVLEEIGCGTDEGSGCMSEDELEEFSGAGAVAGPVLPLGISSPGPTRDITNVARRSFGGLGGKNRKKRRRG